MFEFAIQAFVSILFLVDPPGTIPAFMALTRNFSPARQRKTALVAALTATLALMIFAAIGKMLLQALGLTLPAFQIAGGIVLFLTAIDMIRSEHVDEKSEEMKDAEQTLPVSEIAITPLAIPFLAGPAAMSTVTVLMSQAQNAWEASFVYLAIAFTGFVCYVCLLLAGPIQRRLGKIGIHVLGRVLGLVLAGIAVQFVLSGLVKFIEDLRQSGALPLVK
ncbi:MAG: MarC family protein [Gemmataceae bacterium]